MPQPSVCLNIPKTGSSFTTWFFGAADWLQFKRACRLRRLSVPNRAGIEASKRIKRLGVTYGSLNARLRDHHAGYSTWPTSVRHYPKLCTLRDVQSWYCSYYLYYTRSMKNTLLSQAIRFLIDGHDRRSDPELRPILLRHRRSFIERFEAERVSATSIENISVEFLAWFTHTVRFEYLLKRRVGMNTCPKRIGFLTFRTIVMLFENPARVLGLEAEAFDEYFASGRYRLDLRCDFFLRFDTLTDELCTVMTEELGYNRDIVMFLRENAERKNISPEDSKPPVMRALEEGGLIGRIREDESIYERYLLPLAGSRLSPLVPATHPTVG